MSKVLKSHTVTIGGTKYTFQFDILSSYIFYQNTGIDMPELGEKLKEGKVMQQVGLMANIVLAGIEATFRKEGKECPVNQYHIIEELNDPDFQEKIVALIPKMAEDMVAPEAKKKKAAPKAG